jgi:hypothetical protein
MRLRIELVPVLAACGLLAIGSGMAAADEGDPPAVAARLSYAQGAVSLQPAGVDQWTAAVVNRPITSGDRLWTDQGSRAELQLGSIAIRLNEATGFSFLNLDDSSVQMQVTAGTVEIHVPELNDSGSIEIDTPALALSVRGPGDYRVDVSDTGDVSSVEAIDGEAEVSGGGQSFPLHAQQRGEFTAAGGLAADIGTIGTPDEFDSWCFGRNRREAEARKAVGRYVSPEVTGFEDLDQYGEWQQEPQYGYVWVPTAVPVGWAPYQVGHWVWIDPWGWTWVDSQPWGFAPFHYGRWAHLRAGWCWVPGPPRVRPIYAPALVGWVGGGPGVTVALSVGAGVAWFPLGPRDVYVPPYHVSSTYVRNVNVTNTTVINNTYITNVIQSNGAGIRSINQRIPGAVTAVPRTVFTSAEPVAPHVVRLSPEQLRNTRASMTPPPIAPERRSVLGAGAAIGRPVHAPPQRLMDRPVVALRIPPPAPVPFEKARQAIVANGGRPLPPPQLARLRPNNGPQPFRSAREPSTARPVPFHSVEPPGPGRAGTVPVPDRGPQLRPNAGARDYRVPTTPAPRTDRPPEAQPRFRPGPPRPFERPPVERPPVERPPVERPRVERPPVERPPLERPPVQRPPVEAPPLARPRIERVPAVPHPAPAPPRGLPPPQPHAAPPPHAPPPPRAGPERRDSERGRTQER